MSRRGAALTVLAAALAAGLAACTTTTAGTEHFSSIEHGAAALNSTTFALTWTGPVTTTGTFAPGSGTPKPGQQRAFVTKAGTLTLKVTRVTATSQSASQTACVSTSTTVAGYTVVSARSTGKFKGASGSGVVTVIFSAQLPETPARLTKAEQKVIAHEPRGAEQTEVCHPDGKPVTSTAYASFEGAGPLTVHS